MFAPFLLHRLGPLKSTRHEDLYKYEFEFKAKTDNVYTITPLSNILLFSPTSLKVLGVNDCQDDIATFVGDLGKVSAIIVRLKCLNAFRSNSSLRSEYVLSFFTPCCVSYR